MSGRISRTDAGWSLGLLAGCLVMGQNAATSGFGSRRIASRMCWAAWNTTWNESRDDVRIET